jgi:hypothetical protein
VAQTGTKGHPLVLVRAMSRDQRPVQTNRHFPRKLRSDDRFEIRSTLRAASLRRSSSLQELPAGLITRRRCSLFFISLSLLYESTHIFILSTHLLILIFSQKHISLPRIAHLHHRRRPLSPSQWRSDTSKTYILFQTLLLLFLL